MRSWPNVNSGIVLSSTDEKWRALDMDLRLGCRGLPGGSSLAQLLAEQRGVRNIRRLPPFRIKEVLAWADAYRARTGRWPKRQSGPIPEARGETWMAVQMALAKGRRGFKGASSLSDFLKHHRGVRNHMDLPRLSVKQILAWADRHRATTGTWPRDNSGDVIGVPGETWNGIDAALEKGYRGLPARSSLPRLLAAHRGVRNAHDLPRLTEKLILSWADAFHARTGRWPKAKSGQIPEAPGETWMRVATAMFEGLRGPSDTRSLAQLLADERGVRNHLRLPRLTLTQVVKWARAHRARTGRWPKPHDGQVHEAPGETWKAIEMALIAGGRGLAGGLSLPKLRGKT